MGGYVMLTGGRHCRGRIVGVVRANESRWLHVPFHGLASRRHHDETSLEASRNSLAQGPRSSD